MWRNAPRSSLTLKVSWFQTGTQISCHTSERQTVSLKEEREVIMERLL